MGKVKTCTFTGHRPNKLYGYNLDAYEYKLLAQELTKLLKVLIEEKGVRRFISGGAIGFDTVAFICVDYLKREYEGIENILAVPFANQYIKWGTVDRDRYFKMKELADEVVYVDTIEEYKRKNDSPIGEFSNSKMQRRNEYMVNNSDYIIGLWDSIKKGGTYNCIEYAKNKHTKDNIIIINPKTLEIKYGV